MIRKAIMLAVVAGALTAAVVASGAVAGNTPNGVGSQAACAPGSCFVPNFGAVGAVVKYSGPLASSVEFADCCIAGDKYKVTVKGPSGSAAATWTSSGSLDASCSAFPHANSGALVLPGGANKAIMKAISLPGGAPAGAYIGMSVAGWTQTAGTDQCGF